VKNEVETEAAERYELVGDQNHATAQFHYAVCLAQGRSVSKNQIEVARYYKPAVDQNDVSSQFHYVEPLSTFERKRSPIGWFRECK
jgi:TPR repeat protein